MPLASVWANDPLEKVICDLQRIIQPGKGKPWKRIGISLKVNPLHMKDVHGFSSCHVSFPASVQHQRNVLEVGWWCSCHSRSHQQTPLSGLQRFWVGRIMQVGKFLKVILGKAAKRTKNPKVVRIPLAQNGFCARYVSKFSPEWFWGALAPKSCPPQSANHLAGILPIGPLPSRHCPRAFRDGEAEFIQNHLLWPTGIAEANPPELDALYIQQVFRRVIIFKASRVSRLDVVATGGHWRDLQWIMKIDKDH